MKYILLFLILLLVFVYLKHLSMDKFTCKKIQKTICHYINKKDFPTPDYYMNHNNFLKNILPNQINDIKKLYVKSYTVHDVRKNLNYYFSKYNTLNNDNNLDLSKNKHIELVYKTLRNPNKQIHLKIKLLLTLFNFHNIDSSSVHYVFIPFVLNENTPEINIKTTNNVIIKLIGLYNLDNTRVDLSKISLSNKIDYSDINLNSIFSEDEIKSICKDELSILCKNNFNYFNDSLKFYNELPKPTTISTIPSSCDIFSSQTEYLDKVENSFY
jgi:hypothetical protein